MEEFPPVPPEVAIEDHLSDKTVFLQIWTKPRKVFRFIEYYKYDNYLVAILIVLGIGNSLQRAIQQSHNSSIPPGAILSAVVFGTLFGWIGAYIYAALLSFTGSWIGGWANTKAMLRALTYASIPLIFSSIIFIAEVILINSGAFSFNENGSVLELVVAYILFSVQLGLTVWTLVLCIIGIAEIQKFSILKAILNFLLPLCFFLILIAIAYLFIVGLSR